MKLRDYLAHARRGARANIGTSSTWIRELWKFSFIQGRHVGVCLKYCYAGYVVAGVSSLWSLRAQGLRLNGTKDA